MAKPRTTYFAYTNVWRNTVWYSGVGCECFCLCQDGSRKAEEAGAEDSRFRLSILMAKVDMALFAYHFQWRKSVLGRILHQGIQYTLGDNFAYINQWRNGPVVFCQLFLQGECFRLCETMAKVDTVIFAYHFQWRKLQTTGSRPWILDSPIRHNGELLGTDSIVSPITFNGEIFSPM
jgi:hypothetical protein